MRIWFILLSVEHEIKRNVWELGCVRNLKGKKACILSTYKLWRVKQEEGGKEKKSQLPQMGDR